MSNDDTRSFDDVKAEVCETPDTDPRVETTQHGEYEALHIGGSPEYKHTTGAIAGHSFSLRVDGDAPDALVARVEAALADVKADGKTITLTEPQQERIEAIQEASTEGGSVLPLTKSDVISSLLDTREAVNNGYYTEDHTPNSDLRELIDEWRENMEIDAACERHDAADRWGQAANELEALIDDDTQDNE